MGFVAEMQSALKSAGFDPQGVDGDWGTHTAAAAAACQTSRSLPATGLPEPALAQSLGVTIPALSASLGANFAQAVVDNLTGITTNALDACKLMLHESGMNPEATYWGPGHTPVAVGIFQLLAEYVPQVTGMDVDEFKALTAAQQLPFAAKFWRQKGLALPISPRDLYWVNYLPDSYVPGAPDSYVFVWSDDTYQSRSQKKRVHFTDVYAWNKNLDHPLPGQTAKKGFITADDMALGVNDGAMQNPTLYASIANALENLGATP
jgi:peptidoglycan hydrolase-like protein with peptidoglycan-binding domain